MKIQPNVEDDTPRDIYDNAKTQPNLYDDTPRDIYDNAEKTDTPTVGEIIGPGGATKKADENAQNITVRRSFMRKVGRALAKLGRCCTKRPME